MTIETKNCWAVALASIAAAACGSAPSAPSAGWNCGSADVPNGSVYQCTSTDTRVMAIAASLSGTYTCPANAPATLQCPPPAEDAPLPSASEAGPPPELDAGLLSDAGPPAKDGPPPKDAGAPGDGATPSGDAATPDDAATLEDAACKGPCGKGGNPHGGPPGHGGGTPGPGASPPDSGDTPPVQPPPPAEGAPDAGSGGDAGGQPPFTCGSDETQTTCTMPPTCQTGTHPSACGACVPDNTTDDCVPPSTGGCWVTGGGFIQPPTGQDSFGGNAMPMKTGTVRGQWQNVDHGTGQQMHGEPTYLYCRHVAEPGPGADNGPHHNFTTNQAYFGGPARLDGVDGYWFDVVVDDHGEGKGAKAGGPDLYHITIRTLPAPNQPGAVVYDGEGNLSGGNIQLHPPNNGHPYTGSTLPSWVSLQP